MCSLSTSSQNVLASITDELQTFNDPSSNPAAAIEPFGERAQERAQGERGGTSDLSRGSPVSIDHTYQVRGIYTQCTYVHRTLQTRPAHMMTTA